MMVVSVAGIAGDHKGSPLQMWRNIVRRDMGCAKYESHAGMRWDMDSYFGGNGDTHKLYAFSSKHKIVFPVRLKSVSGIMC